jgi:dCMP deaminase
MINALKVDGREIPWDEVVNLIQGTISSILLESPQSDSAQQFLEELHGRSILQSQEKNTIEIGVSDANRFNGNEISQIQRVIAKALEINFNTAYIVYIDYIGEDFETSNNYSIKDDFFFLSQAYKYSQKSDCNKRKVGSVIVKNNKIISIGFNTAPANLKKCNEVGCDIWEGHCVRTIHAEQIAIINALQKGENLFGTTIYSTHSPCVNCAKLIIHVGIRRIIFNQFYDDPNARKLIEESRVEISHI